MEKDNFAFTRGSPIDSQKMLPFKAEEATRSTSPAIDSSSVRSKLRCDIISSSLWSHSTLQT